MDRSKKKLLDSFDLAWNECCNTVRIVNCNGLSVIYDEETQTSEPENFGNGIEIIGFANTIKILKSKER